MSRTRVQIDLNSELADGLTMAPLADVHGKVSAGTMVTVFEPEDEVEGQAIIERIDKEFGYVFLRVNWDSIGEIAENSVTKQISFWSSTINGTFTSRISTSARNIRPDHIHTANFHAYKPRTRAVLCA